MPALINACVSLAKVIPWQPLGSGGITHLCHGGDVCEAQAPWHRLFMGITLRASEMRN